MRLRYVRDKKIKVNWSDSPDKDNPEFTVFEPEGETSDERGKRLLENKHHRDWFVELPVPVEITVAEKPREFICDVCGESKKSKAGLGAHKRKHKETS
jgi:hypothetical protein